MALVAYRKAEKRSDWLAGQEFAASAVLSFRADATNMFKRMVNDLMVAVNKYSPSQDANIPVTALRPILAETSLIVQKYFVNQSDPNGRHPFGADEVTPLAEYPSIMNRRIAQVLSSDTNESARYMDKHLPPDLKRWFQFGGTWIPQQPREKRQYHRFFDQDPFADYDAPHFWVDPRGYRLSDRIWEMSNQTRTIIDQILAAAIRGGTSPYTLSRILEASIIPGRDVRTVRPYGKNVSYFAMRLARTEISHAHNQATLVSARANPFVDGIDWALSAQHPKDDSCDKKATIGVNGERLQEPYSVYAAYVPPDHPDCICTSRQKTSRNPDDVVAELRAELDKSADENIRPYVNPLQYETFMRELMGGVLFGGVYAN